MANELAAGTKKSLATKQAGAIQKHAKKAAKHAAKKHAKKAAKHAAKHTGEKTAGLKHGGYCLGKRIIKSLPGGIVDEHARISGHRGSMR